MIDLDRDVGVTVQRAQELLQEYWDVQGRPSRPLARHTQQKWSPPGAAIYKINFNGAIFESSVKASLGVVVRDAKGKLLH